MYCHNCGTEIDENQRFCEKCGAEQALSEANNDHIENIVVENTKQKNFMLPIIGIAAAVAIICIIGIFGGQEKADEKPAETNHIVSEAEKEESNIQSETTAANTSQLSEETSVKIQFDIQDYLGNWYITEYGVPKMDEYGNTLYSGTTVLLYSDDGTYKVSIDALFDSTAFASVFDCELSIDGNTATAWYDEDGWGNAGLIEIEFQKDCFYLTVTADGGDNSYDLAVYEMHCSRLYNGDYMTPEEAQTVVESFFGNASVTYMPEANVGTQAEIFFAFEVYLPTQKEHSSWVLVGDTRGTMYWGVYEGDWLNIGNEINNMDAIRGD